MGEKLRSGVVFGFRNLKKAGDNMTEEIEYITQTHLAHLLGISVRRVQQLISDGVITRGTKKGLNTQKAIEEYYTKKLCPEATKNLRDVQAEHEKLKMEVTHLKLRKMKRELLEAEEVQSCLNRMVLVFRNKVLSLPSKIAGEVVGRKNINEIAEIIDVDLREALVELSEYNPELFEEDMDEEADV